MNKMRERRRLVFLDTIDEFKGLGFDIKTITEYQFRINDCLDIFPSNKRYHDLTKNVRGDIRGKTFNQFIRNYFGLKE